MLPTDNAKLACQHNASRNSGDHQRRSDDGPQHDGAFAQVQTPK